MNKTYRLVWSEKAKALVAVAETANAKGKRSGAVLLAPVLLASAFQLMWTADAWAQVTVASGNTKVYNNPNGVQVVDIATANSAGVSHNKFTDYNVSSSGLVLNNVVSTGNSVQSKLGGEVQANTNLATAASLILNEVVSQNRSVLKGYTEVAGAKADVVVANPNGITCNGCGFINTDRLTLTTGSPYFNANGSLGGFRVTQGDVRIEGQGLDGKEQAIFDIVARGVVVDGQVNAKDLQVVSGANQYSYTGRSASAISGTGTAPAYGIDSTVLGGMYANRITLIATEAGVGVRKLGAVAASASDFTLTAAGKIELGGKVSAAQDVVISTTASGSDAIKVDATSGLTSDRDISLSATSGQLTLGAADLKAGRDISLSSVSLSDSGAGSAKRYAARNQTWSVSNTASVDGSLWGAGGKLDLTVGSLSVGATAGTSFYSGNDSTQSDRSFRVLATGGDLSFAAAQLLAPTTLNLEARNGNLSLGVGGSFKANGAINLAAAGTLTNAGDILGGDTISVVASDAAAQLINSGTLQSTKALTLGTSGHVLGLNNSGTVLSADTLTIRGDALSNSGTVQADKGSTIIASSLSNTGASAKWFLATTEGAASSLNLTGAVSNDGVLQTTGQLSLTAGGKLTNSGTLLVTAGDVANYDLNLSVGSLENSGDLSASAALNITASATTGNALLNSGNLLSSQDMSLTLGGGALSNTASGKVLSGQKLTVSTSATEASLLNAGRIQSAADLRMGAAGHLIDLDNSGTVLTGGQSTLSAQTLKNAGRIQSAGSSVLTAGSLENTATGVWLLSTSTGAANQITLSGNLINGGALQSAGNLNASVTGNWTSSGAVYVLGTAGDPHTFTLAAARVDSSGEVDVAGASTVTTSATGSGSFANSGTWYSSGTFALTSAGDASNSGKLLAEGDLTLKTSVANSTLTNSGRIQSAGKIAVGEVGKTFNLQNNTASGVDGSGHAIEGSVLLAGDTLTLVGGALSNEGLIQAANGSTASGSSFTGGSASTWLFSTSAGIGGSLTLTGALTNAGYLQSAGGLTLGVGTLLTNSGVIYAKGASNTLAITAANLSNSGTLLGAGTSVNITTSGDQLNASGGKIAASAGALNLNTSSASATLTNAGSITSSGALTIGHSGALINLINSGTSSEIYTADTLSLSGGSLSNQGQIQATKGSTISGTTLSNLGAGAVWITSTDAGADGNITLTGDLNNQGYLQSFGSLTLNLAGQNLVNSGNLIALGTAASGDGLSITAKQLTQTSTGAIKSANTLGLTLSQSTGNSLDNSGVMYGAGQVDVSAGAGVANSGTLKGAAGVSVQTTASNANLSNSGLIESGTALVLGAAGHTLNLNNSSTSSVIYAGSSLNLTGGSLSNLGTVQATSGSTVSGSTLSNTGSSAKWITSTTAGADGTFILTGDLTNDGYLQSAGSLALSLAGHNLISAGSIVSKGTSLDGDTLTIDANTLQVGSSGNVLGANTVTLNLTGSSGNSMVNAGTVYGQGKVTVVAGAGISNSGTLQGAGDVALQTTAANANLTNAGHLESGGNLILGSSGHTFNLSNSSISSVIYAGSSLNLTGGSLSNLGLIQATSGSTVTGSSLSNTGSSAKWITSTNVGDDGTFTLSGDLVNDNYIQSSGSLTLNMAGRTLTTGGSLVATGTSASGDNLTVNAATINVNSGGAIKGANDLVLNVSASSGNSLSNAGTVYGAGNVSVSAGAGLSNSGALLGGGNVTLQTAASNAVLSNSGRIQSGAQLTAGSSGHTFDLQNSTAVVKDGSGNITSGSVMLASNGMTLTTSSFSNAGTVYSGSAVDLSTQGSLSNSGTLSSVSNMTLSLDAGSGTLSNAGEIRAGGNLVVGSTSTRYSFSNSSASSLLYSGGSMTLWGATLSNSGIVQATSGSSIYGSGLTNASGAKWLFSTATGGDGLLSLSGGLTNHGYVQSAGGLSLNMAGQSLSNDGTIVSTADSATGDSLVISAATVNVLSGGAIKGANTVTINASGAGGNSLSNAGTIYGVGALTVNAGADISNSGSLLGGDAMNLNTSAATASLNNSGRIQASKTLTAGSATNRFYLTNQVDSVISAGALNITAATLNNSGTIQATDTAHLTANLYNGASDSVLVFSTTADGLGILDLTGGFSNAGFVQSAGDLNINANGQNFTNSGTVYVKSSSKTLSVAASTITNSGSLRSDSHISLTASTSSGNSLNNSGVIYGAGNLSFTLGKDFSNTSLGQILSGGSLSLTTSATGATLTNNGWLQSTGAMTLGGSGHAWTFNNNSGATLYSGAALSLTADILNIGGALQSVGGATVTGSSLSLAGTGSMILGSSSSSNSTLTLTGGLTNSSYLQSGGGLAVSVGGTLTNQSGAYIYAAASGKTLSLSADTLDNYGDIRGGGAVSITTSNTLTNKFNNQGTGIIASGGAMTLTSANDVYNAGKIISSGSLSVQTSKASASLSNSGTLDSSDSMTLGATGHIFNLSDSGTIRSSGTLTGKLKDADIQGEMTADGMTLDLSGNLTVGSASNSSALIIGATGSSSASQLTVSGTITNYGAIHSNANLSMAGSTVTNQSTGGMSSLGDLAIVASSGNILNSGAFYAAGKLGLTAPGYVVMNNYDATIDVDGTFTSTSSNFYNYGQVNSKNITVNTTTVFYNGLVSIPTVSVDFAHQIGATSADQTINTWSEGGVSPDGRWMHEDTQTYREVASAALPARKAQMLASGTFNINFGVGTGQNYAGVLSANTMNITGSGGFTNQAFTLYDVTYYRRMVTYEHNPLTGDSDWHHYAPTSSTNWGDIFIGGTDYADEEAAKAASLSLHMEKSRTVHSTSSAQIFASTLYYSGGALTNSGPTQTVTTTSISKSGASTASAGTGSSANAVNTVSASNTGTSTAGNVSDSVNSTSGNSGSGSSVNSQSGSALGTTGTTSSGGSSVSGTTGGSASGGSTVTGTSGSSGSSATVSEKSGTGTSAPPTLATTTATPVEAAKVLSASKSLTMGSFTITFPTNPNGYYVPSKDPQSKYLVETNPRFSVGTSVISSSYLEQRLGYSPDNNIRKLGDAGYENYLIRQQLIDQVGRNLLSGSADEATQTQKFMDNAASQSKTLGLTYGKPLTSEQASKLTQDMVWMEEVNVGGVTVLAPRVYLSAATKASIASGAVISADNATIKATSLTNTGGTISGSSNLTIKTVGDITNASGTISGGNVNLTSTTGNIVNKTVTEGHGDSLTFNTDVGKTGTITATGNLNMNAAKDITVLGGDVSSGGNANLKAGNNITFDTIVNKTTTSSGSSSQGLLGGSTTNTTTTTEKNIGSTLKVGGNLTLDSGKDTTIAGSAVDVSGGLTVKTGGDFNVLARQDKETTHTETSSSGVGVGGGLYGKEKVTEDKFVGTNAGSTINVGGNAKVDSKGSMTLQGSELNVTGDASLNAKKGINVLDGLNEERSTKVTETTTYLKVGGSSKSDSSSSSKSESGQKSGAASAKAGAEASSNGDLRLAETSTTVEKESSKTSVASKLNVGGNLSAKTDGTLTIQGSEVTAGGDVSLKADTVKVLTGRNEKTSTSDTNTSSIGFYSESNSKAEANAESKGNSRGLGTGGTANAKAEASADTTLTVGAKQEKESSSEYSLTNTSSVIKSGGNMSITAKKDATFVGANVEAGGDLSVKGENVTNKAAQDITQKSSSSSSTLAGLYVGASAEANAEASSSGRTGATPGANGKVGVEAKAEATAGVRYKSEQESSSEGSTTQVTNSFKAGGSITRTATNTITDQGTSLDAGGNINQSAKTIKDEAVSNSSYKNDSSQSHDARIGAYVGGSADAGASGRANAVGGAGAASDAGATGGVGAKASYKGEISGSSESESTAVTSKYKSGGSINSTSTDKTTLTGTQMDAKGGVNISAGSLEFKAAEDTKSSSSDKHEINGQATVRVVGKAGGEAEASYKGEKENESSTTARTGSISSGAGININVKGDASFTGTNLDSQGKTSINAGGNVKMEAARDTSESSSRNIEVEAKVSTDKKEGSKGGELNAGIDYSKDKSSTAVTSKVNASGGLEITSGKSATLEGVGIKSDGDVSITAKDKVELKAAKSTESSLNVSAGVSLSGEKSSEGKKSDVGAQAGFDGAQKTESTVTSIQSGGKVNVSGGTVVNQQAEITADGGKSIQGKVVNQKAENSSSEYGMSVGGGSIKESEAGGEHSGGKSK